MSETSNVVDIDINQDTKEILSWEQVYGLIDAVRRKLKERDQLTNEIQDMARQLDPREMESDCVDMVIGFKKHINSSLGVIDIGNHTESETIHKPRKVAARFSKNRIEDATNILAKMSDEFYSVDYTRICHEMSLTDSISYYFLYDLLRKSKLVEKIGRGKWKKI